ncbi:ABC transporter permease [Leifsonia virtsii]|uniref:ABC transporter permease n=1 Tax=Leifsonia virtsii TaxID=3035915 RepID=A0ABT8IZP9_9MICO|nr:ABC transporter permease [Leifsonia virtsii]MDN4597857.1 ABC transporter permease [Leifsonia virtsii]
MRSSQVAVVTRFELARTLRKPQFWIAALLLPAILSAVVLVVAWAGNAKPEAKPITFEYTDKSGLISDAVASALGGSAARPGAGDRARAGELTAYLQFPADPVREPVTVIAADRGLIANGDYAHLVDRLFSFSVDASLESKVVGLVRSSPRVDVRTYTDGEPASGLDGMILPGLLAILLVLVVALLGNQMLNSTVEEKENRISEMLLVSLPARALINGKILALSLLGLVQIGMLAIGVGIIYATTSSWVRLEAIGITSISFDPIRIGVALLLFAGGALMMTALLVLVGTIMPTAKDAAPYYTAVVLFTIVPLYLITTILVSPTSTVIQVLTYFPLTAPMTALILNATGALHPVAGASIGVGLLAIGALILKLAVRTFQRGLLQYDRQLVLKDLRSTRA